MPESDSFHDDLDPQDEFAAPHDESITGNTGNRPAEGAVQASPGDVLSSAFQGSANAGDFLGYGTSGVRITHTSGPHALT